MTSADETEAGLPLRAKVASTVSRTAAALSKRGVELPVFASPTIAGVTLHDTDNIYGTYRERMIEAQQKHLAQFKASMAGEG